MSRSTLFLFFVQEDRLKRALIYLELNKIKIQHVVISGGVASNSYIRRSLVNVCNQFGVKSSIPPVNYCTDNGVIDLFDLTNVLQ